MRKALKTKFSGTKKLVRKVLSRPSISSHESTLQISMTEEALLKSELEALKDQISNLKAAIHTLQDETELKDVAIANLAREKETITLDLLKTKRSNATLSQQLEDERKFYFREKEIYCQEMNECRLLKKKFSCTVTNADEKNVGDYLTEILKLKQTLNHTLEANYNLSIKFLRMKNTKTCLKMELQTMKLEHEKLENDYKTKIENLTTDLNDLVNEKLNTPISPSSKKYLKLVKQNSCLVYENLCLQLEVDNLNFQFEKLKLERTKSETNSRLKYVHHDNTEAEMHKMKLDKNPKQVRIQEETPEKLEKERKACCSKRHLPKDERVIKIFERKETPGIPEIKIVNEKKIKEKKPKKKKHVKTEKPKEDSAVQSCSKGRNIPDYQINIDDSSRKKITSKDSSKLALFKVSDIHSVVSSDYVSLAPSIIRSRSSPEIALSSTFQKSKP